MPIQPQWQDRRGMFQRGREVHEPSSASKRRASEASITEGVTSALQKTVSGASAASASIPESPTSMKASASPVEQKSSGVLGTSSTTAAPVSATPASTSSAEQRRRSSTSSTGSGMFASLTQHKRGGEDYNTRRNSHFEMEGKAGFLSGVWNTTFRGMQRAKDEVKEVVPGTSSEGK